MSFDKFHQELEERGWAFHKSNTFLNVSGALEGIIYSIEPDDIVEQKTVDSWHEELKEAVSDGKLNIYGLALEPIKSKTLHASSLFKYENLAQFFLENHRIKLLPVINILLSKTLQPVRQGRKHLLPSIPAHDAFASNDKEATALGYVRFSDILQDRYIQEKDLADFKQACSAVGVKFFVLQNNYADRLDDRERIRKLSGLYLLKLRDQRYAQGFYDMVFTYGKSHRDRQLDNFFIGRGHNLCDKQGIEYLTSSGKMHSFWLHQDCLKKVETWLSSRTGIKFRLFTPNEFPLSKDKHSPKREIAKECMLEYKREFSTLPIDPKIVLEYCYCKGIVECPNWQEAYSSKNLSYKHEPFSWESFRNNYKIVLPELS